jgi:hypothetical protein
MNVQTAGLKRPKLSLAFAGTMATTSTGAGIAAPMPRSATLSPRELQRIVAAILG